MASDPRIKELADRLDAASVAVAVVQHSRDLFYYAGTIQASALVVSRSGEAVLCVQREVEDVEPAEGVEVVPYEGPKTLTALVDRLAGGQAIGLCLDVTPHATVTTIAGDRPVVDVGPIVLAQRIVKDADEIGLLEAASDCFALADAAVREHAAPGVRELDISAEIARVLRQGGHPGYSPFRRWGAEFPCEGMVTTQPYFASYRNLSHTIAGVGLSGDMPWGASERPVQQGELLFVDLAAGQGGYYSDHARTYSIGEPSPTAERFDAAILAIDAAITAELRPGIAARDVWAAAEDAAAANGVEQWFQGYRTPVGKYLGHGLGVEIDEPPFITAKAGTTLREGMVLAIEPKLIHPEHGGMGHEDLFVLTADGARRLSPAPIGLQVLDAA